MLPRRALFFFLAGKFEVPRLLQDVCPLERTNAAGGVRLDANAGILFKRKKTVALPAESSRKWLSRISQLLFIPDNKIGWIRPAVRRAISLHEEMPFDAILATVPPYSAALVARQVSQKTGVPFFLQPPRPGRNWLSKPAARRQSTGREFSASLVAELAE